MSKFRNISGSHWNWKGVQEIINKSYTCGFCGNKVASNKGYRLGSSSSGNGDFKGGGYICPNCNCISLITANNDKFPGNSFGQVVSNVPEDLNELYNEARECTSNKSYTAAVLLCRKILMTIAVELDAEENKSFVYYVDYLSDEGYIPPNGREWVDHIRQKGNEANHEVHLMTEDDAKELIAFVQMLLKFNYEFPSMLPKKNEVKN